MGGNHYNSAYLFCLLIDAQTVTFNIFLCETFCFYGETKSFKGETTCFDMSRFVKRHFQVLHDAQK